MIFRDWCFLVVVAIGYCVAETIHRQCALKEHLEMCNPRLLGSIMDSRLLIAEAVKAACQMCGAVDGVFWQTRPTRRIALSVKPRAGDISYTWTICDECNEGLQSAALPKPDRVWLLSQVRRATIDDQEAVLDWLNKKFSKCK